MNQRDIAARAAHVEGDDVVDADPLASTHRRDDAAGGAGKHRRHRLFRRAFEGRHTAVGLHDVKLGRGHAHLAHAVLQVAQVARDDRLDIAVDYRRAQAVELANLRQDFIGQR